MQYKCTLLLIFFNIIIGGGGAGGGGAGIIIFKTDLILNRKYVGFLLLLLFYMKIPELIAVTLQHAGHITLQDIKQIHTQFVFSLASVCSSFLY